ncbi:hypothetical protein L7F22_020795 [Adiantum nelumboides]|nr:hypothetical protein [Adiantum nelumboides]
MLGNASVDMYARRGALQKAQNFLEELPVQSVVCWSAIGRYAQQAGSFDSLKEGYRGFSRAIYVMNSIGRNRDLRGCCAGTYFGFNCGLERLRRRRDWPNATVAGAVTGALLAAKSRSASKVLTTSAASSAVATTIDILFPFPIPTSI